MLCLRLSALLALAPLVAACSGGDDAHPVRDCGSVIRVKPERAGADVRVIGSWDGWASPGRPTYTVDDGAHRFASLDLPPGEHGYLIVEDGEEALDPRQPLTTFRGEDEVSLLLVPDCAFPEIRVDRVTSGDDGAISIEATFLAAPGGPPLDPGRVRAASIDGAIVPDVEASAETGKVKLTASGLPRGKYTILVDAADQRGAPAAEARAAAWVSPAAASWSDGVLYQIMVDRYRGANGAVLDPPPTPGSRAGGELGGVTAEIARGTFDDLGVTGIWLSPVYTNPDGLHDGRDGHAYEAYHGYWPLAEREVDPRLGGEEALDALVREAHDHGIRVLFDLVPNHVYEDNPRYRDHQGDGWFNDDPSKCVCGDPGCGSGAQLETCWLSPYLPDVRHQDAGAMRAAEADAIFWANRFDVDGVRVDAVPMMPRATTRRLSHALHAAIAPEGASFALGEVLTGPGYDGLDVIRHYLGEGSLDSAFDFPLMWSMRDVIAHGAGGFDTIEGTLAAADERLAGSGAVIARMLDNHDTSRFISEAAGDGASDPWSAPAVQPQAADPYARQAIGLAMLMTLPGLPVLYYGDEVALAGATDPDSRRVMPSEGELSPNQKDTRALVNALTRLRACSNALRRGARVPLVVEPDRYVFARDASDGDPVIAAFSLSSGFAVIGLAHGAVPSGQYVDVVRNEAVDVDGSVDVPPMSFRVLVSASSPCAPKFAL